MWTKTIAAAAIVCGGFVGLGLLAQDQDEGTGKGKPSDPGNSTDKGNSDNKGNSQSKQHKSIEWLTDKAEVEQGLLGAGIALVKFRSSADLENVQVWMTPSLEAVTASPLAFPLIAKDTDYGITLSIQGLPEHTLGGTLHLRAGDGSSRSYAPPFPVIVRVKGEETEDAEVDAVVSSADYRGGSVTPGQIVSVFGKGVGPQNAQGVQLDSHGRVATYIGDTQVLFDGMPAPLLVALDTQVNAVVPQGIAGESDVDVVVTHGGSVSAEVTLPVEAAAPALFALDGSGAGQSAAVNQDGSVNGAGHRAPRGSVVTFYGSGFGEWAQAVPDGTVIGTSLPTPKAPVSVTIGGAAAKVLYAGGSPGLVSGVVALNVEIPADIPAGDAVTVVVTVGGKSSPANVTVAVQ